jgi:hypothetical protein
MATVQRERKSQTETGGPTTETARRCVFEPKNSDQLPEGGFTAAVSRWSASRVYANQPIIISSQV